VPCVLLVEAAEEVSRGASATFPFWQSGMAMPPSALLLEGNGLTGPAAEYLGYYELQAGREVNGKPVWRHTRHSDRYIAFDSNNYWMVQREQGLGSDRGWIHQVGPALFPCVEAPGGWRWNDGAWHDEPSLKCTDFGLTKAVERATRAEGQLASSRREKQAVEAKLAMSRREKQESDSKVASSCQEKQAIEAELAQARQDQERTDLAAVLRAVRAVRARRTVAPPPLFDAFLPLVEALRAKWSTVAPEPIAASSVPWPPTTAALHEQQRLVERTALATPLDEELLASAVAARDTARRAHLEAISTSMEEVLQGSGCTTVDDLRQCASQHTADAAALTDALTRARQSDVESPLPPGWTVRVVEEEGSATYHSADDHQSARSQVEAWQMHCDGLSVGEALAAVDAYVANFATTPPESEATDDAARVLQGALQGGWLEADSAVDDALVAERVRALSSAVDVETRYWQRFSPPIPNMALLCAGTSEAAASTQLAQTVRGLLERHDELEGERAMTSERLATRTDELEEQLAQVSPLEPPSPSPSPSPSPPSSLSPTLRPPPSHSVWRLPLPLRRRATAWKMRRSTLRRRAYASSVHAASRTAQSTSVSRTSRVRGRRCVRRSVS
jgi:hypothetical protein